MMELHPYLSFAGNCEEALNFYSKVFHGEISGINRYAGSPMEAECPPGWQDKVMHATLVAPGGLTFMASDSPQATNGSRVTLSLATKDSAEGKRVFDALSEGGNVQMPLGEVFWGGSFGMLEDRFGIAWMVSC